MLVDEDTLKDNLPVRLSINDTYVFPGLTVESTNNDGDGDLTFTVILVYLQDFIIFQIKTRWSGLQMDF